MPLTLNMKTIDELIADLRRDNNTTYQAVLELQARVNPDVVNEQIVNEFIELLEHENPMVRECSAVALGRIGDPRAIAPLIRTLGDPYDDYEWRIAIQASNALVKIGEPAVRLLIDALNHPDENVRAGAAQTLKRVKDKPGE